MKRDKLIYASAARKAILDADPKLAYCIDSIPGVDAVKVVHGRWVDRYGGKYANPLYECSACKNTIVPTTVYKIEVDVLGHEHIVQALTDYCPNCGADMRGKEDGK